MRNKKMCLAICLAFVWRGGHAQDWSGTAGDYFGELPVVLSASRLVQRIDEAPAAVTVIDREMIRASGVRDVVDLFRLVPGMVVGMYKGHQPTLGFHGFTDPFFRQLQVLIDGVSIYSPVWGGADWNRLPIVLDDIERIEVVRGPNASTFGANSFLGVVNIITRDPAVEHGGQMVANLGENGIRDTMVRHAANHGDFRYRLTAGQRSDQGIDSHPDTLRSNVFNLRGHYRLSTSDELRVQANYVGGSQGQGVYSLPSHADGARLSHYDSGGAQVRWTRTAGVDDEFWLQLSHAELSHRELYPYSLTYVLPLPSGSWGYPLDFGYEYRRTDLELQNTRRLADSVRSVWGAQVREDDARSKTYFASDNRKTSHLYRLFGNLEWRPIAGWIVAGGAMAEKNSATGTSLSPSLAVNYQFAAGQTVRLRTARARRTPTLYEDRFDWHYESPASLKALLPAPMANLPLYVGTTRTVADLEDEQIRSRELSYLGQFPVQRLNLELHLFEHKLDRLLGKYSYSYPTVLGGLGGTASGFDNLESALIRGRSAVVRWRPWSGGMIYIAGSRTDIHASGIDPRADPRETAAINVSAPRHTVSVLASQEFPGNWRFSAAYYRVGSMAMLSGGDRLPVTERVDVSLAKGLRVGNSHAEIAFVVHNATGRLPVFDPVDIDRRTSWLNIRFEY